MSSAPSRSKTSPYAHALHDAVARTVAAVRGVEAGNPVVLIDGRSGAGKSSLARMLVAAWPLAGRVQVLNLDSVYPGWDGMADGAEYARTAVLVPHARGLIGVWERWDWDAGERAEAHAVDPALPLIVEGCGLLTPASAPLGDVRVWLESPASSRRDRALRRDGDTFRPHWDRWAAQEDAHDRTDRPADLATLVAAVP